MRLKNLLLLGIILFSTQLFAQSKPKLAEKIDALANRVIPTIHSEDVFIKSNRSGLGSADYQEVKKIVMANGFPTKSMVGKENSHKFWMMVQLCDFDLSFQVAVLKQMGRLIRKGEVIKEDYAMLTDRVRMNKGVPQLYGTQYVYNDFGDITLYEVHDEANVDDRRKNMNMSKIVESEKKIKSTVKSANSTDNSDFENRANDRPIEKNK